MGARPAGNTIKEVVGPAERTFTYDGTRLKTLTSGGATYRYLYDAHGNLDCVMKSSYGASSCPAKGNVDMLTDYAYDPFDRLKAYEAAGGASTSYEYDVLDRVEKEKETHPGLKRHIDFTYVGLTDQVATEVHDDPGSATPTARDVTKSYGYDAFGLRLSLTNAPAMTQSPSAVGKQGIFTYAYDVHGSVSALLDQGGNVEATYGYDAYGGADPQLTTGDNDPLLQLNAYRYTGKRTDVGSATIDMGARRFSSDSARFLQPDVYGGALSHLGLSMDPLTGNRYALAAGNPVSYVEVDGHMLAKASGGSGHRLSDPDEDGTTATRGDTPGSSVEQPPPGPTPPPYDEFVRQDRPLKGPLALAGGLFELTGVADAHRCLTGNDSSGVGRATACAMALPWGRFAKGGKLVARFGDEALSAGDDVIEGSARFIVNSGGDALDVSRITIRESKLGYLLSDPRKMGIFRDSMRFSDNTMAEALTGHLKDNLELAYDAGEMLDGAGMKIGSKIGVSGPMRGPSGQEWMITSIWGVDHDGAVRFITAFPGP